MSGCGPPFLWGRRAHRLLPGGLPSSHTGDLGAKPGKSDQLQCRPLSIHWEAHAWSCSQHLGPISCWSQTAHPGSGPAGWSGSPSPSAHTETPKARTAFSPKWPPPCWGRKHWGAKVEGVVVGEMPEMNTPGPHAHMGPRGRRGRPLRLDSRPDPARWSRCPALCAPGAPPPTRPLSPASGSRLHSSVLMPGGPPPHHRQHRSIVRASVSPSGSCREASLQTCRWVTHSRAPRESPLQEG